MEILVLNVIHKLFGIIKPKAVNLLIAELGNIEIHLVKYVLIVINLAWHAKLQQAVNHVEHIWLSVRQLICVYKIVLLLHFGIQHPR